MSGIFSFFTEETVVSLLAFVGGFVDTTGFIRLKGIFASSITGTLVVACALSWNGIMCRILVCVCFALGLSGSSLTSLSMKGENDRLYEYKISMLLFGVEMGLLALVLIFGIFFDSEIIEASTSNDWHVIVPACLMGASMGCHRIAATESIANCPTTNVMTANLCNVTTGGTKALYCYVSAKMSSDKLTEARMRAFQDGYLKHFSKFAAAVKPLVSFIGGCIVGAITLNLYDFYCFAIPAATIFAIILSVFRKYRQMLTAVQFHALQYNSDFKLEYGSTTINPPISFTV